MEDASNTTLGWGGVGSPAVVASKRCSVVVLVVGLRLVPVGVKIFSKQVVGQF